MSAPTEENKKPAGIESFLIVAYRSLRGSKQTSAFGCPKDILTASPEKIQHMATNAEFILSENKLQPTEVEGLTQDNGNMLVFRTASHSRRTKFVQVFPDEKVSLSSVTSGKVQLSIHLSLSRFLGLTVIIYDCYVVKLQLNDPIVERYYRDETGEIKCETTAIPIKPQRAYFRDWVSYGRSFAFSGNSVFYVSAKGNIVKICLNSPIVVSSTRNELTVPNPEDEHDTGVFSKYVDLALHNPKKD